MSYYSYNRGGGFLASIPPAVKNIIIINILVMIMTALNEQSMITRFALFYFVTGLGAALLHTGVQFIEAQSCISAMAEGSQHAAAAYQALKMTPTVGASGAIYGVLLGYAMLFPDSVLTLVFPPISLKANWFVIIFAVIELVTGFFIIGGGIAHFAHLGGMLFGWLLIMYWKKKRRMY